ncbi:protein-L-isoaspartate O-methyltransferase family protein [Pseudomarimonas salicorniae]|uniref:Protein-L-isoaspartate O-methyltransferase n=1 Tax=Pseudomarimonas salicorniae TaxID=2933270 RepID=A0ABT0GI36_9GAMM|nr:protein-L-isoaspartate O-methyltransferase [Lysobacter sp. CAU 1642]MCK7594203.1 protein-L-isoaspartate O-methyltransferase [Lysobacter sp. CAU 1642]
MSIDFDSARHTMVEQQIRPWEVIDPLVLDAFSTLRREDFVPPRQRKLAFTDVPLPLEHGEFMFKPVVEGRLLQALALAPEHEVLEIGTGSGFLTACLAHIARAVTSIELHEDFVARARGRMENLGFSCARIERADAFAYEPGRQFDAVLVGGAVAEVPARFRQWVRVGGRMVIVRGHSPVQEAVVLTRFSDEGWREESLFETDIPYLHGGEPRARFVL